MSLLQEIDAFLERKDMSPSAFGKAALNDPPFVSQLREGRRVWPETEERVRSFMAKHAATRQSERAA